MIESKSLQVHPALENSTIELWQNFGWSLKSTQEVNKYAGEDEDYTYTESYIKLAFQRDTSIPNYAKIKELEDKYNEIANREPTWKPKFHWKLAGILLLLYLVPGIIYLVIYFKKKKEFESDYSAWSIKMNTEGRQYIEEASALLS